MDSQYKVSEQMILDQIKTRTFTVLPSGKTMICELTLENGYTVRGEASVVDLANFDQKRGQEASYKRAFDACWQPLGYLMQERMYRDSMENKQSLDEQR